tara:strand:- start:177 stop:1181 length:1005 start_codon:yes stop_codon:yes gene_type:complete
MKIKYKQYLFFISCLVCLATLTSNIFIFNFKSHHFFGLTSGLLTFFLLKPKDIILVITIVILLICSTITGINSKEYWVLMTYKLITFIPIIVLLRDGNTRLLYDSLKLIFILTTLIAILLVFLGYSNNTFITYPNPGGGFRFAGLVIEPGGYAISLLLLSGLHISLHSKNYKFFIISYIVMFSTKSTVLLLKIILDYLSIKNIRSKIILFIFAAIGILLITIYTRIGLSIDARLTQYSGLINSLDFPFFGTGLYQHRYSMALPGFLRFILETGWFFSFIIFSFIFVKFIWNVKLCYKYIPIFIIPFVQEAYLSALYWYCVLHFLQKEVYYEQKI